MSVSRVAIEESDEDERMDGPLVINNTDTDDLGQESDVSPPVSYRQRSEGIGWFTAALLIVNTALGGGLLNFPKAFHEAGGVVIAALVQGVLIVFITPALLILCYCSDYNEAKTMQDTLYFTWGKFGQRLTSVCMALYCFGSCITYMIIIGDQLDQVFAAVYGETFCHYWYMNRNFTMVLSCILFVLPLCYPKKIDFLKHASSVGVVAVVYVVFLIIGEYYSGAYVPGEIKTQPDHWTDVFLVIPTLCFGYQCHVSIIPIYACLQKRTVKNFSWSVYVAIVICVFTYTVAAAYGYLTFGAFVASDILKSYDPKRSEVLIANVAVAIKTYVTYPVNAFCGREAISDLWLDISLSGRIIEEENHPTHPKEELFRRMSVASVWFALTLLLAVVLPNIGAVIKLLGSLAALFIFFLPGLCLLRVSLSDSSENDDSSKRKQWLLVIAGMYLALGAFIFGLVFTQGIYFDFVYDREIDISICTPLNTTSY